MRITIYIVFSFFFVIKAGAQSLNGNSLFTFNHFAINPAAAGDSDQLKGVLQARTQTMNVGDNYIGSLISLNGKVNENVGLGAKINTNTQGAFEDISLLIGSSYTTKLTENHKLSFGMALGITRFTVNANQYNYNTFVNAEDPLLINGGFNSTVMNISAGLVYQWNGFQLGLASPNLFQNETGLQEIVRGTAQLKIEGGNLTLMPMVLARLYESNPTEITGLVRIDFNKLLWLQGGYRNNDSVIFGAGFLLKEVSVGYAYGMSMGAGKDVTSGGHEIILGINFGKSSTDEK